MSTPRKSIQKPHNIAFQKQNGRCYYCGILMWRKTPHKIMSYYKITFGQAKALKCTGEHLQAHKDGGSGNSDNIVAACYCCNHRRHQRKHPPKPSDYKNYIQNRLAIKGWHNFELTII